MTVGMVMPNVTTDLIAKIFRNDYLNKVPGLSNRISKIL